MSTLGLFGLFIAFAAEVVSVVCLFLGQVFARTDRNSDSVRKNCVWGGYTCAIISTALLTFCCGLLVFCFLTDDISLQYVVENRSAVTGAFGWLYRIAGLWAGRAGSLLFWAWVISLFNLVVALRVRRKEDALDNVALLIAQLVLSVFTGILLFSDSNMPFVALDSTYLDAAGELTNGAQNWGMNALLEHWAMAIHPPTLFIGYAGMTIPCAYAIAALVVNESSSRWVERASGFVLFSWLFLGIGIGLGAVWAYSVLGWGGYWGWDPVENASLLPWLVGIALIHSFTVYRQRGEFKRWSVMCACLAFVSVLFATFVTRSGLVQSVHGFATDDASPSVFLVLIVLVLAAGIIGLVVRQKSFAVLSDKNGDAGSMASRDVAYYFNNVIIILFTILLAYMTISSALPSWLPFGGRSLSAVTYESIARPLGIIYCALVAICPLLSWRKTSARQFLRRIRVPALCALILFVLLMVYFVTYLVPSYTALVDTGGSIAATVTDYGPTWYYFGLTVVGFAVASLLFFTALFTLVRTLHNSERLQNSGEENAGEENNRHRSLSLRSRCSAVGGFISHLSMAVILVGLIGSSMYVTEKVDYLSPNANDISDSDDVNTSNELEIQNFTLVYTASSVEEINNGADTLYTVEFDVYDNDRLVGHVDPAIQITSSTSTQRALASVISFPDKDLFVTCRGISDEGSVILDVRINPCITFVWIGFGLMILGALIAFIGATVDRRRSKSVTEEENRL